MLEDFIDGYVTLAQARKDYGVVIDAQSKTIDGAATESERANHPHTNGKAANGKLEGPAAAGR